MDKIDMFIESKWYLKYPAYTLACPIWWFAAYLLYKLIVLYGE